MEVGHGKRDVNVPRLYLDLRNRDTNVEVVKRYLETYCRKNYYHLRNCLDLQELPQLVMPERNAILNGSPREGVTTRSNEGAATRSTARVGDEALDLEYAKIIMAENIRAYHRKLQEREKELSMFFGVVMELLDLSLRQKVMTHADYEQIRNSDDGFRLWKLVYRIATTAGGIETQAMREERIISRYETVRMKNGESLSEYHERFRAYARAFTDNGLNGAVVPSDARQAVRFINGLDNATYYELKRALENSAHLGLNYPTTLAKALEIAANYKSPEYKEASRPTGKSSTVYHTRHVKTGEKKEITCWNCGKKGHKTRECKGGRGTKSEERNRDAKEINCWRCGKAGHKAKDCKSGEVPKSNYLVSTWDEDHEEIPDQLLMQQYQWEETKTNYTIVSQRKCEDDNLDIILDSGAQISIFRDQGLLLNVHESPTSIVVKGVSNDEKGVKTNMVGNFPGIRNVNIYVSPHSSMNIVSMGDVIKHGYQVKWNEEENYFMLVNDNGEIMVFKFKDDLYKFDRDLTLQNYANQISKIDLVKEVSKRLSFESPGGIIKAIREGSVNNLPITTADVYRYMREVGTDVSLLKGKATRRPAMYVRENSVPKALEKVQTLHADIMFVEQEAYLISVSEPLDLTMAFYLKSIDSKDGVKSANRLMEALLSHISTYWSEGFNVQKIICDGEKGFRALNQDLLRRGIKLITAGPNRHGVPKVDRRIRMIKERLRCLLNDLPYTLPYGLLYHAVAYVVSRINMIRHSDSTRIVLSPREQFTGRRTDYKIDLNISFGDYVETDCRESNNRMRERTESCIALYPTGNQNGSVKFFSIKSQRIIIITRERWRVMKISESIINDINLIALRHKKIINDTLRVERSLRRIPVEEEEERSCDQQ